MNAPGPVATGVAQAASSAEAKVLLVAESARPDSLNPYNNVSMVDVRTIELMQDALFTMGENWDVKSSLVDSENGQPIFNASADRFTVQGRLKAARFQDGSPVTVADLKASLLAAQLSANRPNGEEYLSGLFSSIDGVAPDAQRMFRVKCIRMLPEPKQFFVTKIVPRKAFTNPDKPETWYDDLKIRKMPVGAGPFKYVPPDGSTLNTRLVAFKDYHQGAPRLDEIQIMGVPDDSVKLTMLQMDTAHVIVSLKREDQIQAHSAGAIIRPYYLKNWWYLGFNMASEPLSDLNVRAALGLMIDRFELARQLSDKVSQTRAGDDFRVFTGQDASVTLLDGPFVPESPYYNRSVTPLSSDPAAGRKKLGAIPGFSFDTVNKRWLYKGNPFSLRLAYQSELPGIEDVANVLEQQLRESGITVRSTAMDQAEWLEKVRTRRSFDLALGRFSFYTDLSISRIFKTKAKLNLFSYSNPEVDKVFELAEKEKNFDVQTNFYKDIFAKVARDLPCLFLWEAMDVAAFSPRVRAFNVHSWGFYVNAHRWDLAPKESKR